MATHLMRLFLTLAVIGAIATLALLAQP